MIHLFPLGPESPLNLTKISVQEIQAGSRVLSELYHVNATKLENEIKSARAIVDATNQTFSTFQELAHFLLTELPCTFSCPSFWCYRYLFRQPTANALLVQ